MDDTLAFINEIIVREKGVRVIAADALIKADLDSAGILILFAELHAKYGTQDTKVLYRLIDTIRSRRITIQELIVMCTGV